LLQQRVMIVPCRVAVVESRTGGSSLAALSLFCLWSLLVFYHDSSHLTMMLPAFVFLLAADDRSSTRQRWSFLALLQVFLMYDVPNRLGTRHVNDPALTAFILNFDRLLAMATSRLCRGCVEAFEPRCAGGAKGKSRESRLIGRQAVTRRRNSTRRAGACLKSATMRLRCRLNFAVRRTIGMTPSVSARSNSESISASDMRWASIRSASCA
jgi:hypothetical protein